MVKLKEALADFVRRKAHSMDVDESVFEKWRQAVLLEELHHVPFMSIPAEERAQRQPDQPVASPEDAGC